MQYEKDAVGGVRDSDFREERMGMAAGGALVTGDGDSIIYTYPMLAGNQVAFIGFKIGPVGVQSCAERAGMILYGSSSGGFIKKLFSRKFYKIQLAKNGK